MAGVVFVETLRRGWRSMLLWALGISLIGAVQMSVLGDVDALEQMAELLESMPPFILQLLGTQDVTYLATPPGFLAARYFSLIPLVFAAYAVASGMNVTANEEDRSITDVLLSAPLPRWRLVLEKVIAYALMLAVIVLLSFASLWLIMQTVPEVAAAIDGTRLFEVTISILPGALVVLAFTVLAGALARGRGSALALAAVFVIGSFFIDFVGSAASGSAAAAVAKISYFSYYNAPEIMQNGMLWGNTILLIAVALVLVLAGVIAYQRRDIGT